MWCLQKSCWLMWSTGNIISHWCIGSRWLNIWEIFTEFCSKWHVSVYHQCSLLLQITEVEHVNAFTAVVAQVCSKMPYSVAQCFWINMWWLCFFFSLRSIFSHLNNMSKNPGFWSRVIPARFHLVCVVIWKGGGTHKRMLFIHPTSTPSPLFSLFFWKSF